MRSTYKSYLDGEYVEREIQKAILVNVYIFKF